ncbi:hypothetical protein ACFSQT_15795 [Mesorhizobium calcicola]|uniref:Uncharacterized protein n=1 Tax=Mesorhizobium calcicola TaxID=1300310 RepID=A0ABW4WF28_9HYPH
MAGNIAFGMVPRLPDKWWDGTDADTVWPTWGKNTLYLWGANSGNQFIARGQPLNGGGMASVQKGPTRGRGHPQYIGIDTMELSPKANDGVFDSLKTSLNGGEDIVVPVYMKHGDANNGSFGLGTGYGLDVQDHVQIHAYVWAKLLELIVVAAKTDIPSVMWTPDVTQATHELRNSTRVALPDLAAVKAWAATLAAAS